MTRHIVTSGSFADLTSRHVRFLHEISLRGTVHLLLFDDNVCKSITGSKPEFPLAERRYFLESVRYVHGLTVISDIARLSHLSTIIDAPVSDWFVLPSEQTPESARIAASQNITLTRITDRQLQDFPPDDSPPAPSARKKVVVTGCFDYFHTGHVRFLEEVSEYGDLYAIVGHDKNIRALKGPGHPMFGETERRFMVGAVRFVTRAIVSTGDGWLDAEPEIHKIKPDIYAVNEDGDKDIKRQFCRENGIEYLVLKREPKTGLNRRTSTNLRGF
jgi:cytidyltransferase-like protein